MIGQQKNRTLYHQKYDLIGKPVIGKPVITF